MSSLKEFLYQIADEIGRPHDSMEAIIKQFQENWYDTVDSLRAIDDSTYEKLKVPTRLVELIKKKLAQTKPQPKIEKPAQILPQKPTQQKKDEEMMIEWEEKKQPERGIIPIEEIIKQKTQKGNKSKSEWIKLLERLKKEIGFGEKLETTLLLLEKITSNIMKEPAKEQYRTLKVESNQKIKEAIGIYPTAVEALILLGFEAVGEGILTMKEQNINLEALGEFNAHIHQFLEDSSTNVNSILDI